MPSSCLNLLTRGCLDLVSNEAADLHSFHLSHHSTELDYYNLLGIPRDASQGDIKIAYHRTLLQSHPDKRVKSPTLAGSVFSPHSSRDDVDIALIKEAYKTLIDSSLREGHDTSLNREASNGRGPRPAQVVSLEEFVVHDREELDATEQEWRYSCRCGGIYRITEDDLECGRHLVGCQSCSEVVWVGYELVED